MGNLVSFLAAILCVPNIGAFLCSVGAVLFGHVWKNVGYFVYDCMLYGAAAFLDLTTLSAKSVFEVILTLLVLAAVRRKIGVTYLIEEHR